ncbi:MAG: hypothetical protein JNK19_01560 [Tabrizicola sp.]|nr:hypothetical protein [Tabrizicola sp.]
MRTFLSLTVIALGLFCLLPGSAAQAACYADDNETEVECPGDDPGPTGQSLNTGVTREITKILRGANDTCADDRIELRYRIDCLRIYYLKVADRLPDTGDYVPVKKAMLDAAAKLEAIVEANLDERTPPIRPREGHKPAAKRMPLVRPVKEELAEIAAAEAARVVEETELIIIRSGGDPARRTPHYNEVAAAVEENLVILRSA